MRKIIFSLLSLFSVINLSAMTNNEFSSWWREYRNQTTIPEDLKAMALLHKSFLQGMSLVLISIL